MPHRKLVQIGSRPPAEPAEPLPTVAEYFRDMAQRQGEDIRLLKERAAAFADLRASRRSDAARRKSVREESWRLHPVVAPTAPKKAKAGKKRSASKPSGRKKSRPSAPASRRSR